VEADAGRREVPLDRGDRRGGKERPQLCQWLLRLTLLVPDIQEAIIDGRQAKGMQLEELTKAMPRAWLGQRKLIRHVTIA
jgi:ribosome-binding protein aMBF1 (putative translation factor)